MRIYVHTYDCVCAFASMHKMCIRAHTHIRLYSDNCLLIKACMHTQQRNIDARMHKKIQAHGLECVGMPVCLYAEMYQLPDSTFPSTARVIETLEKVLPEPESKPLSSSVTLTMRHGSPVLSAIIVAFLSAAS